MIDFKLKSLQKRFEKAIEKQNIVVIKELIYNEHINPFFKGYHGLMLSISLDNTEIVELYLKVPNIDLSFRSYCVFRTAADYNAINALKLLINKSKIDPIVINNYAIKTSYKNDNKEIISYLFSIKRVREVLKKENPEMFQSLLKNEIKNKIKDF